MVQYIYIVKCPHCEDEHFNFFDEAKGYALGCINKNPIITQVEVDRNDFGECTSHADLGTVWSWEDVMAENPEAFETKFSKNDLAYSDEDFDDTITPFTPPADPSIDQLVEMMEENEDTVECKWCNELFDKSECRYEVDLGWLCQQCIAAIESRGEPLTFREGALDETVATTSLHEDTVKGDTVELEYDNLTATVATKYIPATWEEPADYEEGEFTGPYTYEADLDKVIEVLLNKFLVDEDFADLPGGRADLEDDATYEKFLDDHLEDLIDKYYQQLLDYFKDDAAEEASNSEAFQNAYNDAMDAAEDDYWDRRYEEERDRRRFGDDD